MKKTKKIAIASLVFFAAILAACSSSVSSSQTYSYVYSGDPDSLDYVIANRETTSAVTGNLVDGLLENDKYGNLVPSLAEKWTVSKDGLTYTYTLRKGAKWYTSDGEEYADVKAQDFVTGLKHAADGKSEALYLVQNSIKGLDAYIKGESKDFSTVGVKALDDHTVQYTLNQPESYWNSKTTSGILFPVNADFLASQGSGFGAAKPSSILYNGPYLLKSLTAKSSIEYKKNANYWDKDNVLIENVKLSYYDGSDQESLVRNFTDGAYTLARVFPNSSNYASVKKKYADNITYSQQGGTSFFYVFNVNRQAYHHTAKTDDKQKADTKAAILNKDFRQAVGFAFDRKAYAAQTNGEDGATMVLRNLAVPPTFVQIKDKNFGEVVQEKLTTLGQEWSSVKLDDAQDGLYNVEKAKAELGIKFSEYEPKNAESEAKEALEKFAETGEYDLIIGVGFTMKESVMAAATAYPDQKFAIVDETITGLPNVTSLTFKEHEGSFLVGALAAMMSKTGTVGFIGGMENPVIQKFEAGFVQGAKYINPNIKVLTVYIGGSNAFNDPASAKTKTETLIQQKADVVYHAAGGSGAGVFQAAKEKNVYAIGVDSDQDDIVPGTILTSMMLTLLHLT